MLDIENLRIDEREKDIALAAVTDRLETLQVEDLLGTRVDIASWGEEPVCTKESRPLCAALGAHSGLLLWVAIMIIFRRASNRTTVAQSLV